MDTLSHYLAASQPAPCSIELINIDHLLTDEIKSQQHEIKYRAKQWSEEGEGREENDELLIETVRIAVKEKVREKTDRAVCPRTADTRKSVSREPKSSSSRYARIIKQKNRIIQQLIEELERFRLLSNTKSFGNPKQTHASCFKEREFLQKNNSILFEEIAKCRQEKSIIQMQFAKLNKLIPTLVARNIELEAENSKLRQANAELDRGIRELLATSHRQVVIVSKMRQILADKLKPREPSRLKKQDKRANDKPLSTSKSRRVEKGFILSDSLYKN